MGEGDKCVTLRVELRLTKDDIACLKRMARKDKERWRNFLVNAAYDGIYKKIINRIEGEEE
jgi:hypothetical protein